MSEIRASIFCHYLPQVVALARIAGQAILDIYNHRYTIEKKGDGSPLTEADRAAHEVIIDGLAKLEPRLPVLSEESSAAEIEARRQWPRFWLVDPLDGTKEFINRRDEFTVNIALIDDDRPVLGVVHSPVIGLTYWACEGQGAYRELLDEAATRIHARRQDDGHTVVVASRLHAGEALEGFLQRVGPYELSSMGSSLKLCLVAEGSADIYPRLAPTSEWDTAAAHCVVNEAGGHVVDLENQPLVYNKENILNPWFVACGDTDRDWLSLIEARQND